MTKMKEQWMEVPGKQYVKEERRDHGKCNYGHIRKGINI